MQAWLHHFAEEIDKGESRGGKKTNSKKKKKWVGGYTAVLQSQPAARLFCIILLHLYFIPTLEGVQLAKYNRVDTNV